MHGSTLFVGPLDRVLSLRSLPVMESLTSQELVTIAQNVRERFISRGSVLARRGELLRASYLVLDGRIEIGTPSSPLVVERGSSVGLLELLARQPFAADARAVVDTLVLELDTDDQEDVLEDHFSIMAQYLKYLARATLAELYERRADDIEPPASFDVVAPAGPLNLVERILSLHRIPMLSSESIDAVAELSSHATEETFAAGGELFRRDNAGDDFWIVLSGRAVIELPGAPESFELGAGSCVGLEECLAEVPRRGDCRAKDELVTLRVSGTRFVEVLEDHFPMARHVMMTMARTLLSLRAQKPAGET